MQNLLNFGDSLQGAKYAIQKEEVVRKKKLYQYQHHFAMQVFCSGEKKYAYTMGQGMYHENLCVAKIKYKYGYSRISCGRLFRANRKIISYQLYINNCFLSILFLMNVLYVVYKTTNQKNVYKLCQMFVLPKLDISKMYNKHGSFFSSCQFFCI